MRIPLVLPLVVLMAISASVQPATAEEGAEENAANSILAKYDQGFRFTTRDGNFALRLNGYLQARYSYVDYDPAVRYNQQDYSNFYLRRARLFFSGHTGTPRLTYLFHVQLEPSQGLSANDLWLE